jgi:hypothetical protein
MTNKMSTFANRVLFGLLVVVFVTAGCNNKKDGDKKDPPPDTASVKPADPMPPKDTAKMDTADVRPVKTPD